MKKIFFILGVLIFLSCTASALALPTIVSGHVYESDGSTPVPNVEVSAICNTGDGTIGPLTDITNQYGFYVIEFGINDIPECPVGSEVTVSAGENSASGIVGPNRYLQKNLIYINFSIPEFGVVGAGIALAGAVTAFMLFRKRH
ncbi:MAG: hypothetical protein QXG00_03870 [Candidatus Woesearchaeota archaeon]